MQMPRPGVFFYLYLLFAFVAIWFSFDCEMNNGSCFVMSIWGLTGCQPWPQALKSLDPNGSFTPDNIIVMSAINALLIYLFGALFSSAKKDIDRSDT